MENVIKVIYNGVELGAIVRSTYHNSGIGFFSGDNDGLQLGYMNRPDDHVIAPHTHNKIKREVFFTEEIQLLREYSERGSVQDLGGPPADRYPAWESGSA